MTDQSSNIKMKEKPRICALDLDREIIEALQARGLHCYAGTLGSQVKVPNSGSCSTHPCLLNYDFPPNLHEYDIVIVDLQAQEPIEYDQSEHTHSFFKGSQQLIFLSSYPETIFDPRPISSSILARALEGFLKKETLIIVFASAKEIVEYHRAVITPDSIRTQNSVEKSLYEFIPCLLETHNKTGQYIEASNIREDLKSFLQTYTKNFVYEIVFKHPTEWLQEERKFVEKDDFMPLLLNYDNEIVGFASFAFESSILVFPQLKDRKKKFVLELINDILPGVFPKIFPYSEQFYWLKQENYLLPKQASLFKKKEKIENEYKSALIKIEKEIQQNQTEYQFLHNLITETSEQLVKSVEIF